MEQSEKWLLEEKYNGKKTEGFFADLKRLAAGEPRGYVIGHVPFLGWRIYLDSRPLIPRPETEFWVEKAIEVIEGVRRHVKRGRRLRILDLCAGSGAIGVAVAKAIPETEVTFAEIDPAHLPTIEKNIFQNLSINQKVLEERFTVIESDLFSNVEGKFDFILTNPPYIDPVLDRTEASVKNFEPHLALYGGVEGLDIIDDIVKEASKYLNENGQLWIEHEPEQSESILELASQSAQVGGGYAAARTFSDQYGVNRYSVLHL